MSKQFRLFKVSKPCANCPFLKSDDALALQPGRLADIKRDLLQNDNADFYCHKTLKLPEKSICAGSMAFLMANSRASISMRLAFIQRLVNPNDIAALMPLITTGVDEG